MEQTGLALGPALWWAAAGIAVAVELATGTFYLLMIALGLAAGALAAHLGLSDVAQIVTAAVVGGGATALWHWRRYREPRSAPAPSNRDVNLDIGERVHVAAWSDDRTARVGYRGSTWTARLAPGAAAAPGEHRVVAVENNWLVLAPQAAQDRHDPHGR
jgi:membrane protein implicated in regulation of membrane protease activity